MTGGDATDYLGPILERKRREVARRLVHRRGFAASHAEREPSDRAALAEAALRRSAGDAPKIIAEIKLRSPSAGTIRARESGLVERIARRYVEGGASAVSVLCDGPGFGGTPLDPRRVARAVRVPVLFKEFVVDACQVALARAVGAHMVLLIVRALDPMTLRALVAEVQRLGMAPVVEAADEGELERALQTDARIVGVNARDLRTFRVDPERARRALERIPRDRIAVHMSGVRSAQDVASVAGSRADAALVGEALMRAEDPGALLRSWLGPSPSR